MLHLPFLYQLGENAFDGGQMNYSSNVAVIPPLFSFTVNFSQVKPSNLFPHRVLSQRKPTPRRTPHLQPLKTNRTIFSDVMSSRFWQHCLLMRPPTSVSVVNCCSSLLAYRFSRRFWRTSEGIVFCTDEEDLSFRRQTGCCSRSRVIVLCDWFDQVVVVCVLVLCEFVVVRVRARWRRIDWPR